MIRLLRIVLLTAATLVAWATFRVVMDSLRQADPRTSPEYWSKMSIFGEEPEEHDHETLAKRWCVAHENELQWVVVGLGGVLVLREFGAALGFQRGSRTLKRSGAWDLGDSLLRWSRSDCWTLGDSFAGTFICGANGSGKTSGSGRHIAKSFLRSGYGGLVVTAKSEETRLWQQYCRETGREKDLIIFSPSQPWRFDPLDYEMTRPGVGAGQTESIVQLISTILEMAERGSGQGGGREEEGYWKRACRQLCRNAVDAQFLGEGSVTVPGLHRLVTSAPTSLEQMRSEEWRRSSYCFQCLRAADQRPATESQQRDFELVADYFLCEFPALSEKTRSVIVSTFTSMIDVLNRGVLRELVCSGTNITPEVIEQGKIVVIDLPVKEYAEVGQFAQVIWKYAFQRSIERRDIRTSPRPVFLWADEAQYFVTNNDMQFLTTCRAYRVANVYLTQNVNNLYAALGGLQKGKAEADSILGCLNTKIWHANSDPISNELAANLIGRTRQFFVNANSNSQEDWISGLVGMGDSPHSSAGVSESYELEVQPAVFTTLRTGGPANKYCVDSVVFQNGKIFADMGTTWRYATFDQRS